MLTPWKESCDQPQFVYYMIDNTGYKMAREALWPCWTGMWLSSMILLPIGVFLTYKAATDSALFNPDAWLKTFRRIARWGILLWRKLRHLPKGKLMLLFKRDNCQ